jgi:hypothetical protein
LIKKVKLIIFIIKIQLLNNIILSKQILISNYSDYNIINNFLLEQFDKAFNDFEFNFDDKFLITLLIVAAALPSMIILITYRNMDNLMLFTSLFFNIVWLTTILYIQPIGSGIKIYTLYFILFNNIFLSITRLIYINLLGSSRFKELFGKLLGYYIKFFYVFPNYVLRKLLSFASEILNLSNNRINNVVYDLLVVEPLNLIAKRFDEESKHTLLTYENNKLLDHLQLFKALFSALILEEEFKKIGKKIMIVAIVKQDKTFYIHKNIIIDENTNMKTYLDKIKSNIQAFYDSGYPISTFPILEVKLWDLKAKTSGKKVHTSNTIHQSRRSLHTTSIINSPNLIKPLKIPKNVNKSLIATIDLETIELNNNQIPISISFSYFLNGELITIFELIDYKLLKLNSGEAVKLLWFNFMNKINDLNLHKIVIFSHNLGSFDGYFLFKGLLELPGVNIDKVNSIIDELHRFISIDVIWKDTKFVFKDSLRIFPISLNELCNIFEVEGKLFPYNLNFNKISLFENIELLNQFIEYSKQDSISLLKALIKAQDIYITEHSVDIASIWSTSTLSFKIFRQKFLDINIPILNKTLDSLIRLAYIGGSTDYYLKYGENLKHYDVNSLYPKAMCNPMPIEFLNEVDGTNVNLQDVFGFAEAKITAPNNLEIPLLPFKLFNETIHPLGSWIGIYFTEELKAVAKYGYKIELIKVYNFSKSNIFTRYIEYFYRIKRNSTGALRVISKLHLNTFYGYFGRRKTLIETKNVYTNELMKYYGNYTIFSEIKINEHITTILMGVNLDFDLINEVKEDTTLDLITSFRNVKSNVAIAAAVTSYARIEMMKYKTLTGIKLFYTDTDSIIVEGPIPSEFIGEELGQMKDELKGGFIKKAYFLGIKKYGYIDDNNLTHSVFAGIERNSLNWNEIEQVAQGTTVIKNSPPRFYKNLSHLNIQIKNDLQVSILFNPRKKLINNRYIPIKINIKFLITIDYYLNLLKNKIIYLINKYNLRKLKS